MQEFIGIILDYAQEIIFAGVTLIVARVVIPWLKEKRMYDFISKLVKAADKLYKSGQLEGTKLEYVTERMEARGYTVDKTRRAFIESAVTELDIEQEQESTPLLGVQMEDEGVVDVEMEIGSHPDAPTKLGQNEI